MGATGAAAQVLSTLAREMIDLMSGPLSGRNRECASGTCPLVFVDSSRPGPDAVLHGTLRQPSQNSGLCVPDASPTTFGRGGRVTSLGQVCVADATAVPGSAVT